MIQYLIGFIIVLLLLSYSVLPTYAYRLRQLILKASNPSTDRIYLTFDDGPDTRYTEAILDLLKELGIKASFFVVASFAERNPHIIERMKKDGHCIGLHSLEHKDGLYKMPSYVKQDFNKSLLILKNLDVEISCYRPPWGHFNLTAMMQIRKYGLKPIMWDVMAQDWRGDTTAQVIAQKLKIRTKKGTIICLHDGRGENDAPQRTLEALRAALPILLARGLRFDTVDNYGK